MITKTQHKALSKMSQCQRVMWWFENKGSLTGLDALQYLGIYRLAARINDLRKSHVINTHKVTVKNQFGEACPNVGEYEYVGLLTNKG